MNPKREVHCMVELTCEVSTQQARRQLGEGGGTTKTQGARVSNKSEY
jgi:hypothetical protein